MNEIPDDRLQYTYHGYTYVCRKAPSRLALRCGLRVAATLAPVMAGLTSLGGQQAAFAAAMRYLFTNPDLEDKVLSLVDAFAPYTEVFVDGTMPPASFNLASQHPALGAGTWLDVHFAGKQDELLDWLGRVCDQNLRSFLGGILAKAKEAEKALSELAAKAKETSSESPNPAAKTG